MTLRSVAVLLGVATAVALPMKDARAEGARRGLETGIRTGVLLPLGSATSFGGDSLSNTFGTQIPLLFEMGYRRDRFFFGGFFGQAAGGAGGTSQTSCDQLHADCFGRSTRVGAELHFHLSPSNPTHAWIGYGVGYEWASFSVSAAQGTRTVAFRGPEYGHMMVGVDVNAFALVHLGLVFDLSFATYTNMEYKSWTSGLISQKIDEPAVHQWAMFGLRGVILQ